MAKVVRNLSYENPTAHILMQAHKNVKQRVSTREENEKGQKPHPFLSFSSHFQMMRPVIITWLNSILNNKE